MTIVAFLFGIVVGGLVVVLFSKNNKNTIATARREILDAVAKGKDEVEKVLNKHS